jgi:predicted transcriptional regulator
MQRRAKARLWACRCGFIAQTAPVGGGCDLKRTWVAEDHGIDRSELLALTAEIVTALVGNNAVAGAEVAALIQSVFDMLSRLGSDEPAAAAEQTPAVPIRRSVSDDHIVCLEDGRKLKMLKRHLMTDHGMTPEQYRAKWGLRRDYPMIAPNYSVQRQALAKQIGLGRKPAPPPPPEPTKPTRRRKATA